MKKIILVGILVIIQSFVFAESFPAFPMTIYWEIKIWNSPLEEWTINIHNSLNQELISYEITEEGKYWSDNASILPLLLNEFEWNLIFEVSHNWKTYTIDSIDDSHKKSTCPDKSSITFVSDNCRYDILLKEEKDPNETWNTNTWDVNTWDVNTWNINTWTNNYSTSYGGGHRSNSTKNNKSEWEEITNNHSIENDSSNSNQLSNNDEEIQENWFTKELNDAYQFSYKNWITTKKSIEDADMEWLLTRIQTAKMLSYYAINILWKKPDLTQWSAKFYDITDELNEEYNNAVTLASQLWIMWVNMDGYFRPHDIVSRAEFGTALSRMLFWTEDWSDLYFTTHLNKLKEKWIIKETNPDLIEIRWYAMIMLMRAANKTTK